MVVVIVVLVVALITLSSITLDLKNANVSLTRKLELTDNSIVTLKSDVTHLNTLLNHEQHISNTWMERYYDSQSELDNYQQLQDIGEDFMYIARVVAAESRGESYEGQMAVAQTIQQRAFNDGCTLREVASITNQYAPPVSEGLVTESVMQACIAVFFNYEGSVYEPITYFYSTADGFVSEWHENNLEYVCTIGNHKFFKEK